MAGTDATAPIETDALVIGAGPVGLYQAFQLGLQDLRSCIVDVLPQAGGQCIELYPDKPIYDIPALPVCSGRELAERLLKQIEPFDVPMHFGQHVSQLAPRDDGRFDVATDGGLRWIARAVVIAAGVGAFQPRKLPVDGLDAFAGMQLRYALKDSADATASFAAQQVVIVGNGGDALAAVARLADAEARPASITLIHRRDQFQAPDAAIEQLHQLRASGAVRFIAAQPTGFASDGGRLTALQLLDADAATQTLPVDQLLVLQGLSPKLGPIAQWGLGMDRKQIAVDTARFESNVPGIHAVGDINSYAGKRRLIVSGFHEATLAAFAIAARVRGDDRIPLLYTTTSPKLQRLLRVAPPADA